MHTITTGLLNHGIDLQILTVSTEKHPFHSDAYPDDIRKKTNIDAVFIDTRVNIIDAFSALVTSDSYNVSRFFSPDFDTLLINRLREFEFDLIHLESLFMTPYISTIRNYSRAKIVLRSHNLEHLIWERLANSAGNKARKIYLKHLASKLKTYEKRTLNEVDGIATISSEDTQRFSELQCKVPLVTIPFGVDLEKYPFSPPAEKSEYSLFHLGAMNWTPNLEAINWFLDSMWADVSELPVTLHLAGREMPTRIQKMASPKMTVLGDVENAITFMQQFDIMIVPLLSGSGMRIKIIEGMALGKVVITTSVGAEGINCESGKNILIADSEEAFVSHIKMLTKDKSLARRIGTAARNLVEEHYNNAEIIQKLLHFYDQLKPKNQAL